MSCSGWYEARLGLCHTVGGMKLGTVSHSGWYEAR